MIKNYIIVAVLLVLGALLSSYELSVIWSAPVAFFTGLMLSYQTQLPKLAVDQTLEKAQRDAAMRKLCVLYILCFFGSILIVAAGYYGYKML